MFKRYLILMFLCHVVADFYIQPSQMSEKGKHELKWVLLHCLLYGLSTLAVSIPVMSSGILILAVVSSFNHAIIDIITYLIFRGREKRNSKIFIFDQLLHIMSIFILAYIWTSNNVPLVGISIVADFLCLADLSGLFLCKWLLGLLVIQKPANLLIQSLIGSYKPQKSNEIKIDNNIGRRIGTAERFIMFILIYLNQYSAIGLVLTAKSIARYDQITKEEKFAEYYLLGTLTSVGITVICSTLLF